MQPAPISATDGIFDGALSLKLELFADRLAQLSRAAGSFRVTIRTNIRMHDVKSEHSLLWRIESQLLEILRLNGTRGGTIMPFLGLIPSLHARSSVLLIFDESRPSHSATPENAFQPLYKLPAKISLNDA